MFAARLFFVRFMPPTNIHVEPITININLIGAGVSAQVTALAQLVTDFRSQFMASNDELQAKLDANQQALDTLKTDVSAKLQSVAQTITDLKNQLASGMTPDQVQAAEDKADAALTEVQAIDAAVNAV